MAETSTIDKLVDVFRCSRSKGEVLQLFLESKNRKDSITFILNPTGSPAGRERTWSPSTFSSARPWLTASQPMLRRKKSPSMLRRDQRGKTEFLAKKAAFATVEVKEEPTGESDTAQKVTKVEPVLDEITLTEIPIDKTEFSENEIINIVTPIYSSQ